DLGAVQLAAGAAVRGPHPRRRQHQAVPPAAAARAILEQHGAVPRGRAAHPGVAAGLPHRRRPRGTLPAPDGRGARRAPGPRAARGRRRVPLLVAAGALPPQVTMFLFFDLDGPLLDVSPRYVALHHDLLAGLGARGMDGELYWQRKRARVPEEAILAELGRCALAEAYNRRRLGRIETPPYLAHDRPWPWA